MSKYKDQKVRRIRLKLLEDATMMAFDHARRLESEVERPMSAARVTNAAYSYQLFLRIARASNEAYQEHKELNKLMREGKL
jgi:hypothetical protein